VRGVPSDEEQNSLQEFKEGEQFSDISLYLARLSCSLLLLLERLLYSEFKYFAFLNIRLPTVG
jgi:hypothetical protein